MQVSKFVLAVCATTVCAGFLSLRAQDTPAQAAARAALMQSMGEPAAAAPTTPATQPPPATPAAPAVETNAPILVESSGVVAQPTNAPAQTSEVATPVPAAVPVVTAPQPLSPEAQAAARAALLQSMGQTDTPATPAPAPTVPAPVVVAPAVVTPVPAIPATNAPTAPAAKPVASNSDKANKAIVPGREPGFPPMVAPPLPISTTKEQQLEALLAQYKADQISPEEYQKQRAAILAAQ